MTKTEILTEKMKDFTDQDKRVLRQILDHGLPLRSELFESLPDIRSESIDMATGKAVKVGVVSLDPTTHRYSVGSHFKDDLKGLV